MTLIALLISVVFIIGLTARFKVNAFIVLILAGIVYGLIIRMPLTIIIDNIQKGFGSTLGYIGIVIITGTMLGIILERTGAAFSITNAILKIVGKKYPNLALTIAGYITSIAVFCDSGFVILNSINKALAKRSKLSITVTSVSLATGLYSSHCLIPPATGPIAATQIIGANIGTVMLVGAVVAIVTALAGFLWATFIASKYYIEPNIAESYEELLSEYGQLPSATKAIMPILVPIILILLASLANPQLHLLTPGKLTQILDFLGKPTVALIIGLFTALFLLVPPHRYKEAVSDWFAEGIKKAALSVAIVGAGGAFGQVLKGSPIGEYLGTTLSHWHIGIFLPFLIAAALKIAQGSSTVALITGASIVSPLLARLGLNPVLAVAAIGAGSMTFSHANDAYYWVVSQFSDIDTTTAYKVYTAATLIQGLSAMVVIYLFSLVM